MTGGHSGSTLVPWQELSTTIHERGASGNLVETIVGNGNGNPASGFACRLRRDESPLAPP